MKTLYFTTLKTISQYPTKFYITAYGLILLMAAGAVFMGEKEIILPELAALSIGCFVYKKKQWINKPLHLFLLPSATAFLGFFINRLEINMAAKIVMVLVVMFLMLYAIRSNLAPALATGLLPIVTNCSSYLFIASILFFTALLALLVKVLLKQDREEAVEPESKPVLAILVYLAVLILWITVCWFANVIQMAAIPPVIVIGYELIDKKQYSFTMLCKQVTALVLAASVGAFSIYYLNNFILAAAVNFIAVALVLQSLKIKMPPVYAMTMLPMVLPGSTPGHFVINSTVMTLAVLGIIYILINKTGINAHKDS